MPSSPGPQRVILTTAPNTTLYTSCPPEEIRQVSDSRSHGRSLLVRHHSFSPEPDSVSSPSIDTDAELIPRAPSTSEQTLKDGPDHSARSITSSPDLSSPDPKTRHRYDFDRIWQNYPYPTNSRPPLITSSFLRPGSKFQGTQESDRQVYNVQVEIKYVDMAESFLCGYLRIQGLTDDHPTLTTYFEGEIVGPRYKFVTAHPEWGSSEKVDLAHWGRFPEWKLLQAQAKSQPNFSLNSFEQREHLFMRWKEYFLVPDHTVKTISGASFEGFYYICFNQCTGTVSGIYFHAKSEKFQQLELFHVPDRGCTAAIQFC